MASQAWIRDGNWLVGAEDGQRILVPAFPEPQNSLTEADFAFEAPTLVETEAEDA